MICRRLLLVFLSIMVFIGLSHLMTTKGSSMMTFVEWDSDHIINSHSEQALLVAGLENGSFHE